MSISQEQRASLLEQNRKMGWEALPSTVPAFVRAFVTEYRTAALEQRSMNTSFLQTHQQGVEQRSLAQRAVRFVKNVFTSNADLYAHADRIARQIRKDEAHARAEAERKFFATASPAELLRALEAKIGMREQPGSALSAQPGSTPCTACTPDQHSKAATYHRTLASKAASWQEGAAHHTAADCHAKAAEQFNADNSVAARSASEKCLDEYGDEDQEDEY
jgi:hypothetical protein